MIVHASIDERGKISGGSAGDQTRKEVCTRTFYSKPWNVMLRYEDTSIAEKASEIGIKLANSNLVGYDQRQRNTLYTQLKKCNWNVDEYIKSGVKTETDCSAFQYAIYCCLIPSMRKDGNAPTTSTMKSFYLKHGFTAYTDSRYLTSDAYLKKGDLLIKEGSHVVQNVTNGSKVTFNTNTSSTTSTVYTHRQFVKDVQAAIEAKIDGIAGKETYSKCPTVSKSKNNRHAVVKPLQKYLNALGYNCGIADGIAGVKFDNASKAWAKANGCVADGEFTKGGKSWRKILGIK